MDPQQRLLLEVSWEALQDAGQVPQRLAGTQTGVFIGIATNDYGRLQWSDLERIDAYAGTGNALSIAANRISYVLDFRGPSIAIDTACSSSLVAVHLACSSLRNGESTLALAGGVNLILSPAIAINFTKAGAMAADGRCKTFDARADGYVRSEGAGVVVLKPLSKAVADGDPIYAIIRGSAVNQDGRSNGLMAPNPAAQEAVLREAYRQAAVSPGKVQYVEAHGHGNIARGSDRGAGARRRDGCRPFTGTAMRLGFGQDQPRSPRGRRRYRGIDQGGAVAPVSRDSAELALRNAQPADSVFRAAASRADRRSVHGLRSSVPHWLGSARSASAAPMRTWFWKRRRRPQSKRRMRSEKAARICSRYRRAVRKRFNLSPAPTRIFLPLPHLRRHCATSVTRRARGWLTTITVLPRPAIRRRN